MHAGENDEHEFYPMCDDVDAFIAGMKVKNVECGLLYERRGAG